jgi:uncharacterized membrane protein YfcA
VPWSLALPRLTSAALRASNLSRVAQERSQRDPWKSRLCFPIGRGNSLFAKPLSVPARFERLLAPVIGLTTGLINGGTGVFTLPAVPYLQALGLSKDDLIQALGLSFTVSTIALAAGLARGGAFHLGNITLSALAVIPALLGMQVGTMVRERISAATFRRWFLILIAILGLELAVHPFLL